MARVLILVLFVALLAAPFLFQTEGDARPDTDRELIIVTPHNEQIRYEFARGFSAWHEATYGEPVNVVFNAPGGTSEIRRMLEAEYRAAFESGTTIGGSADLVFGGGSYEFGEFKKGVTVSNGDGTTRKESLLTPIDFDPAWLDATYGIVEIGDKRAYDPDRAWFGAACSGFGIVSNLDVLARLEIEPPEVWSDLADPRLRGWVALVNPGQSGSVTTAMHGILTREGWEHGWRIMRRAAANARYFSGSSLRPPTDVSQGDAAMGMCIDFYGRYQAQAIREATGDDRVVFVVPRGGSEIDPDPVAMLRGAPHPELAQRFVEYVLSNEGQALWQLPARGDAPKLGPRRFELRRLPMTKPFIDAHLAECIDPVDPFAIATRAPYPNYAARSFIAVLFGALAMDTHHDLQAAWTAIVTHPAYPADARRGDGGGCQRSRTEGDARSVRRDAGGAGAG